MQTRTTMAPRPLICWLCCVVALYSGTAHSEWGFDASGGFTYDDNLSNAFEPDERKGDTAAVVDLAGGYRQQLGDSTSLGLSLLGTSQSYLHYTGLSNIGLGARALLRTKFGLGAEAPWLALAAQGVYHNYHDDNLDGWSYEAGATLGKRFGDRWTVSGSVRYDAYVANSTPPVIVPGLSGSPYDVYGWNVGVQARFLATESDLVSLSYNWRTGTVTSVTEPDLEVLEYSDRVARTTIFGSPEIAYRINANTQTIGIAWSHTLGQHTAFNVAYAYRRSQADSELGVYYANVISITVSYSY